MHGIKTNLLTSATRAIAAVATAVIGLLCTADDADADAFPLDTPVRVTDVRRAIADAGTAGTLAKSLAAIADQASAEVVVVRIASDTDPADQNLLAIGGTAGASYTGAQALLMAETVTGVRPRILVAPGLDTQPVTAALITIAKKLRGMVYAAGIGADIAAVDAYAENFGDREVMLIWPDFTGIEGIWAGDAIARAAGLRAYIDQTQGWHKTLSNVPVQGVLGITKDVYFDLTDSATDAQLLNDAKITTLIRSQGFRFWGNRTCSAEPLFSFESAVRTSQVLQDEIADGLRWAIDKPLTQGLVRDIVETINARLRTLISQGRVIGAAAWFDPALNSAADLAAGKLVIDYDFTPAAPLEGLDLNQRITDRYYADFADLAA